jgi:hypothetical protein
MGHPVASITNLTLTVVRNIANVTTTIDYDITFDEFDRRTNLRYLESSWRLIGDDTGQDGDDGMVGDDLVLGEGALTALVSADGLTVRHRTRSRTDAWTSLNEDSALPAPNNDDEIRAVVTLTPQLPITVRRESAAQVVSSP